MGPSGTGKTTILRTVAGLWEAGSGDVVRHGAAVGREEGRGEIMFVPQRPYMVLGSLRDQLLYPMWGSGGSRSGSDSSSNSGSSSDSGAAGAESACDSATLMSGPTMNNAVPFHYHASGSRSGPGRSSRGSGRAATAGQPQPVPSDAQLRAALRAVQLGSLLERVGGDLDAVADWAAVLSGGEQQRLAFARWVRAPPSASAFSDFTSQRRLGSLAPSALISASLHSSLP